MFHKDTHPTSPVALSLVLLLLGGCASKPDPVWAGVTKEMRQSYGPRR